MRSYAHLILALALALTAAGCPTLDGAYWKVQAQQHEAALTTAKAEFDRAHAAATAAGTPAEAAQAQAFAAAVAKVEAQLKDRLTDEALAKLRAELPALLARAASGDWTGAGLGGAGLLSTLLLFLYGRVRLHQLAEAVTTQATAPGAAGAGGLPPDVVAALTVLARGGRLPGAPATGNVLLTAPLAGAPA